MKTKRQQLGALHESRACTYLEKQGLKLVEKNFYCQFGEIDLVMQAPTELVFVEVRYRSDSSMLSSLESIGPHKRNCLRKSAMYYLVSHRITEVPCRFDIIGFDAAQFKWIKNAFQFD